MSALMLLLSALLAPPMPAQPDAVQYATVTPAQPIIVAAGGESAVSLEKGHAVGLGVLASDGIVTPNGQCAVVFTAAAVGASGPIAVAIEMGQRDADAWEDIGSGSTVVPLVTAPLELGHSIRLIVRNNGPGPVVVWPAATRLSVVALGCVAPFDDGVALQQQTGIFAWLGHLCSERAGPGCVDELVRHYHALDSVLAGGLDAPPARPPQGARSFHRAAPWLFMQPAPRCDSHARTTPGRESFEHARAPGPGAFDHQRGG